MILKAQVSPTLQKYCNIASLQCTFTSGVSSPILIHCWCLFSTSFTPLLLYEVSAQYKNNTKPRKKKCKGIYKARVEIASLLHLVL